MDAIAEEEAALGRYAAERMAELAAVSPLRMWPDVIDRIGVATFTVAGFHHGLVAAALSAEHGVAARDGCFCAHPLMLRLLNVDPVNAARIRDEVAAGDHRNVPGAVRLSTGIATTTADLDLAFDAVADIAIHGPRWTYRADDGGAHYRPDPDDRPWPALAALARTTEIAVTR